MGEGGRPPFVIVSTSDGKYRSCVYEREAGKLSVLCDRKFENDVSHGGHGRSTFFLTANTTTVTGTSVTTVNNGSSKTFHRRIDGSVETKGLQEH